MTKPKVVVKPDPLRINDFEHAVDAGKYWSGHLLSVVEVMRKKLEVQKQVRPNADYAESDRNLLIMEQSQKVLSLLLMDHQIILNKLKQKSDEQ